MFPAAKFVKPAVNEASRVVVVWVEKAREHSRGRRESSGIVNNRPKLHQKGRASRQLADAFRPDYGNSRF